jgi:hypothetical protein
MKKNKEERRKYFDLVLGLSSRFMTDHKEGPYLAKSQNFKAKIIFNCLFNSNKINSAW